MIVQIEPPKELEAIRQILVRMGADFDKALGPILNTLANAAKKRVQSRMGAYITNRTGWLRRHVYGVRRSQTHYVVAAPRHISEPLERGATIQAKGGKFLSFNGVRVKSVTIPPKRWFTRAYDGFEESQEYGQAVDKGIQKVLKKYNLDDGGTA